MKKKTSHRKGFEPWSIGTLGQHAILFATNDLSCRSLDLYSTFREVTFMDTSERLLYIVSLFIYRL